MPRNRPQFAGRRLNRAWALAIVLALGMIMLGGPGRAQASPGAPHHHCACEEACRGASCCCASPEPKAPSPPVRANTPIASNPSVPCLGGLPCGGGDAPSIPQGTSAPKAALSESGLLFDLPSGKLGEPSGNRAIPATYFARLDDPPETTR